MKPGSKSIREGFSWRVKQSSQKIVKMNLVCHKNLNHQLFIVKEAMVIVLITAAGLQG
eukprot:TRINITY_DN18001_c0_g1_i1.p1 TRINITY_DN18001_c0_g1~~TRINITY_DN18001_c0_g1_i1.p1  ORF type:complete len:58 (+),score=2.51 TRINITY_DN18001_c0_g1_i1:73-246(+)